MKTRRFAFTLPEVLTAMLLIGIVVPAVLKGISLALQASDDARKRIEATSLAQEKLSELAADATSGQGSASAGDFGPEKPAFRWESTSQSPVTDLLEIRVRVSWTAHGNERAVDLSTFQYTGAGATGSMSFTSSPAPAAGGTP
jgi:prepilin-type N-terminal cleavage/methylation domain-containing protein